MSNNEQSRFDCIELDLTPEQVADWHAKRAAEVVVKSAPVVAPVVPVVETTPVEIKALDMGNAAWRPLTCIRMTRGGDSGQGVQMSPRMHRFYRWCDDNKLGLNDWSTDIGVLEVLPRLEQLLIIERDTVLLGLAVGSEEGKIQGELVRDIQSIMQRVPANRSQTVQTAAGVAESKKDIRKELIAVAAGDEVTGGVVYWQLTGVVDRSTLVAAMESRGLEDKDAPALASPELALGRAMRELQARNILVRRLKGAGGWAVLHEREVNAKLETEQTVRIYLSGEKDQEVVKFEAQPGFEAQAQIEFDRAVAEYNKQRAALNVTDLSSWLVKVSVKLDGIPLRDRGGMYFVPRASIETFRKVKESLMEVSGCQVYEIPAMHSTETVKAIFDAVGRDAQSFVSDVEGEYNMGMGKLAAKNRKEEVEEILKRVRSYAKLLNQDFSSTEKTLTDMAMKLGKVTTRTTNLEID